MSHEHFQRLKDQWLALRDSLISEPEQPKPFVLSDEQAKAVDETAEAA
jgi:hypothetical protein